MKYIQRTMFRKCSFELREDTILVVGTTDTGTQFEGEVSYADLRPRSERQWVHSELYWSGVRILCLSAAAIFGLAFFLQSQDKDFLWRMAYVFAGLGIVMILIFQRKVEKVIYHSSAGIPLLEIVKVGPDKAAFGSFVQELQARILRSNKLSIRFEVRH